MMPTAELKSLPSDLAQVLAARSRILLLPAAGEVFLPGQPAASFLLLLSGYVRVQQHSDTGRDVFLYRVQPGESCVLTTACMLADEDYSAEAVAESDVQAVVIPRALFAEMTGRSDLFRRFVFNPYVRHFADLFALIAAIIFQRVDVRLAALLLQRSEGMTVSATHHVLAAELAQPAKSSRSFWATFTAGVGSTRRGTRFTLSIVKP